MKLDILAFAAHPDDVEISCGGTLIKYQQMGKKKTIKFDKTTKTNSSRLEGEGKRLKPILSDEHEQT